MAAGTTVIFQPAEKRKYRERNSLFLYSRFLKLDIPIPLTYFALKITHVGLLCKELVLPMKKVELTLENSQEATPVGSFPGGTRFYRVDLDSCVLECSKVMGRDDRSVRIHTGKQTILSLMGMNELI